MRVAAAFALSACVAIGEPPRPVRVVQGPIALACLGQPEGCRAPPRSLALRRAGALVVVALEPAADHTFAVPPMRCRRAGGEPCAIDPGVVERDQSQRVELATAVAAAARSVQLRLRWFSCDRLRCVVDDGLVTVDLTGP